MESIYDYTLMDIEGEKRPLSDYRGRTLLIVNVASNCGFTPQYVGLETLYQKYKQRGFLVLGIPCNQFAFQESGSNEEIKEFCQLKYQVTFPLFAKLRVNGKNEDPLYTFLKSRQSGIFGSRDIKWNFTKFLITKEGEVIKRFAPTVSMTSVEDEIKKVL